MKALQITGYGEVRKNLTYSDIETPAPGKGEVLIKVKAAAVNPIDYKIIHGLLKPVKKLTFPAPVGYDVSGIVEKCGEACSHLQPGDEVFSRAPHEGTFAQYVAIDESLVVKKPANLSFEEAASLPLVGLTTLQAFSKVDLKAGQSVLIHAGSGGVGSFAIQYAKLLGAKVYTTTSSRNKSWVKALGADVVIDYNNNYYPEIAKELDVVYDTLGEEFSVEAFDVIRNGGKVISIAGPVDEQTAKHFKLNVLKRLFLRFLRRKVTQKQKEKSASYQYHFMVPDGKQLEDIKTMAEEGKIKPVIDSVYPFDKAVEAIEKQSIGRARGKIIIQMEN
jgi:NADPH:quinone reductase-like Zn-dependent oxidoreductase